MPDTAWWGKHVRIAGVARELGVHPRTLRRWEERRLIPKPRRDFSGQRIWNAEEVAVLRQLLSHAERQPRPPQGRVAARNGCPPSPVPEPRP